VLQDSPTKPFRVLLVESSAGDRFLLQEMLERDCAPRFQLAQVTDCLARAIEIVRLDETDVALLDLTLPDSDGIETFTQLHRVAPHLPVIALCEKDDEELGLLAVQHGAAEHLPKGMIDGHLLRRAMRYAIERGRSEAALARERDLFDTLLENIPDRIYFKDCASRFIRINAALTRLLRLNCAEEAYGKTDKDFYDEHHAAEALADEQRVMATGESIIGKVEFEVLSDGRRSWSLTTKMPLRNRRGEIIGTCGISRAITELKEMELALSAERNLLRSVIDNLPDAIFLKDCKGRYLLDNTAHWRGLELGGSDEVIGRSVFDFFPKEIAEEFHRRDTMILQTGEPLLNQEERTVNRKGESRWILTTKIPWRDDDGSILGVLCITRDITEQKLAGERLRRANIELEHSREATLCALNDLQRAHTQLREVQLQLIDAEKMKSVGRLAAGVAHEVKNPLAVVRMGIEFLYSHLQEDTAAQEVIQEMFEAVARADAVVRGLLDFSAPKRLNLTPTDLNALILQALVLVRGERRGRVELVREFQMNLPNVPLDPDKMSQVFINVLSNAFHAMPEGGTLAIRTYSKQLTGVGSNVSDQRSESFRVGENLVVTEIDDTGEGIPEDKLPKIFEPFFTTKPTGSGTGLGLSVVKTIVDLHGASIDVRNLPDGGTRVSIMFRV
jgi:PAS domain S-box-containing protein